jgi:hypothetical protein
LAILRGANLSEAVVDGTSFASTTLVGFTPHQLYATRSYQDQDLHALDLSGNDLSGLNLAAQNLTGANIVRATLTNADFSFTDLRGANFSPEATTLIRNTILPDGTIDGLNLAAGERLVAYAGVPIPVKFLADFSIAPTAALDLTDNAAILEYAGTSPAAMVREHIISGRGGSGPGGEWTGTGITSSTAAKANQAQPDARSLGYADNAALPLGAYTRFRVAAVDESAILIAYTRTGDANLDGVVNDDDVTIIGATYAPGVPQPSWALGDFDYNGFVDDDDVTLLNAFYEPSAPPLNSLAAPGAGGELHSRLSAVPEPSTLALLAAMAAALLVSHRFRRASQRRAFNG